MSTQKNEQYHILSPEWLKANPLPDDAERRVKGHPQLGWVASDMRMATLFDSQIEKNEYRTQRTDLPPEAYVTPPTETTGSGREGETDEAREFVFPDMERQLWERLPGFLIDNHEGDILTEELLQSAAAELLAKLKSDSPPDLLDGPTPLTDSIDREQDEDENYARGPYRTLSKQLERRLSSALAQVEALRRDGERWQEYRKYVGEELTRLRNALFSYALPDEDGRHEIAEKALGTEVLRELRRAAIDSAQRQEGK